MAYDLTAVCEGLAQVVSDGTGLRCHAFEPDAPIPPCAYVSLGGDGPLMEEPHEAFADGLCRLGLTVRLLGSEAAGVERGLRILAQFLGSGTGQESSVLDAIYADTSFGGALSAGNVRVLTVGAPRPVETMGGLVFIGVDIPLVVYATRI